MRNFTKRALILTLLFTAATFSSDKQAHAQAARGNGVSAALIREAERVSGDRFTFETETARGARVLAVRQPSAKMLEAIDLGLNDLFVVARKNNLRRRLAHSDYTIFIARADRAKDASNNYSPDIAIGAAQYAGTQYDKGGYIYAAGMVVAFNPLAFVIAEHDRQFTRVAEVVRYEGEHLVLYHNDRKSFNETRDHSKGGGHPILD